MKNTGALCLVLLCLAFTAFLGGFFLGRNANHAPVQISGPVSVTAAPQESAAESSGSDSLPSQRLNINTATAAQLTALPGIGPALAQRIVDYRQANGPFTSTAQLMLVEGIGEKRLAAIADYITTGG